MEIIKIYADKPLPKIEESVACIGYFDGLHTGHQKLFEEVKILAKKQQVKKACICFDADPWIVMKKSKDKAQLTPFALRLKKIEEMGIDLCYVLHFDEKMMKLTYQEFIDNILKRLRFKTLVCGEDFHFAFQGQGNIETLKAAKIPLQVIKEVQYHDEKVSSSHIEVLLKEGKIEEANHQLGYAYTLYGKVIHGNKKGRSILHFPTANVGLDDDYVMVKSGVYSASVCVQDKHYQALVNIGHNPTMNYRQNLSIEAHLFHFDTQIYGEDICVSLHRYLREEKKFDRIEDLITQLQKDIEAVQKDKGQ